MTGSLEATVPLILAGGRGTRIADIFPDLPKPAILVAGKPFLAWLLAQLSQVGFARVVVSGGYRFDVLKEKINPHVPKGMEVVWVKEEQPLGTGGGAIHAAKESKLQPESWLVMNGDSFLGGDWPKKIQPKNRGEACLVARKVVDSGRYGRVEVDHGRLIAFREKQGGGPGLINAGIYLFPGIWLNKQSNDTPRSMELELIPGWIREGQKINILEVDAPFLDIGIPEDYYRASAFFYNLKGQS